MPLKETWCRDENSADRSQTANDEFLADGSTIFYSHVEILVDEIYVSIVENNVGSDRRVKTLERHDDTMQVLRTDTGRRMKPQMAFDFSQILSGTLKCGVNGQKRFAACVVEGLPLRGWPHDPRRTFKQSRTNMLLEVSKVFCDTRLSDLEITCGGSDGATLDCTYESSQSGCNIQEGTPAVDYKRDITNMTFDGSADR